MNQNELRQTAFDVVPLKNVVGIGRATAFQIHVRHGAVIATPTEGEGFTRRSAANDGCRSGTNSATAPFTLFRRLLRR